MPVPTAIIVHRQNFNGISLVFKYFLYMLKVYYKIFFVPFAALVSTPVMSIAGVFAMTTSTACVVLLVALAAFPMAAFLAALVTTFLVVIVGSA